MESDWAADSNLSPLHCTSFETLYSARMPNLWLIRHGETTWSAAGRHTGRTDVALTPRGERQGERLRRRLGLHQFALVLTSPLRRACDTSQIAGYGEAALPDADLSEWDYGGYEGRTSTEIRVDHPGWTLWDAGVPGGETVAEVGVRADRVLARALLAPGDVALFAHGHLLRVLAARWLRLAPATGRSFALNAASVGVLARESEQPVIELWNDVSHLAGDE
jgi:broad specificity phosphatase PhoE